MKPRFLFLSLCLLSMPVLAQNAKQYIKAGNEFVKTRNYTDAEVQFTKAIELAPNNSDAYLKRADVYEHLGKLTEAAEDYVRASSFLPKEESVFYNAGRLYFLLRNYGEALNWVNKAIELKKNYQEAIEYKIRTLIKQENYADASACCTKLLSIKETPVHFYLYGIVLDNLNDYPKAESNFEKAIAKDKTYVDAFIALANLRLKMDKTDQALENINQALRLEPSNVEAYLSRSRIYVKKLDYPDAINDVSKTILISPNEEQLYFIRGTYYQKFTQHQNAINDFNKVLLLNNKNSEAYYLRAHSYEEIANYKEAIKDYESLLSLCGSDEKAKRMLDEAKSKLYELNREYDKPDIKITDPVPVSEQTLGIPKNRTQITLKGEVTDQSDLSFIKINAQNIPFTKGEHGYDFTANVDLGDSDAFTLSASDIYNNVREEKIQIKRTEINPPKISLTAPYASDDGQVYLDSDDPDIYMEGNVSDESPIQSILIDGVAASYRLGELNPKFTATLNILNKNTITITATDIYGNKRENIYKLNREGVIADNPMGKTWTIFIENASYQNFASLEGPPKDITLMRSALVKYSINNVIQKKDMSKKDMERFFSIELRDLIRSNHVNSLMVWYAGHGKFINETGYWIPVDAARDDEFTYYNINALRADLQSYTNLTHLLIVTDACESGPTFYQAMRSAPEIRSCNDWQATKFKSSQVFSSAGYELAVDNSQFTKTFATTLANNPDACVPIELIVNKVTQAVVQNKQQKPQFGKIAGLTDENGTFFFIVKNQ